MKAGGGISFKSQTFPAFFNLSFCEERETLPALGRNGAFDLLYERFGFECSLFFQSHYKFLWAFTLEGVHGTIDGNVNVKHFI
jgi:hypothetical protein